jgi:hypothetical protein
MQISRSTFLRSLGLTAAGLASSEIPGLARAGQVSGVPARATRITAAEVLPFTVPLKGPQRTALGTTTASHGVYVRLKTAEGVTGLGESAPNTLPTRPSTALQMPLRAFGRTP